jgi:hypothetical protein
MRTINARRIHFAQNGLAAKPFFSAATSPFAKGGGAGRLRRGIFPPPLRCHRTLNTEH